MLVPIYSGLPTDGTEITMAISRDDRQFLLLCDDVRKDSHDPDRKVGAVISDSGHQVLATGTNAPPSALRLTVEESHEAIRQDRTWKYFMLEHAERNAIFAAYALGKSLAGATMYSTLFPCADCARAIVASGLSRLVVLGLARDPVRDEKWLDHYRHASGILAMAGVAVVVVDPEQLVREISR
ncbi:MAG TPA: deaminase [Bradyrhizobium sp.]|jgi:dCMP deaminase|nr:deaminase [Bradyrhizobium sp.]